MSPPTIAPSGWRATAGAPKDGTRILAVSWGDTAEVLYFDRHSDVWRTVPGGYGREPIRWTPIPPFPPPPTEAESTALNTPPRSLAEAEADILREALEQIKRLGCLDDAELEGIVCAALAKTAQLRGNGT